jgi:hypothetical protein
MMMIEFYPIEIAVATATYAGSAALLSAVPPSSNQSQSQMFFTFIPVKALQQLVGCTGSRDESDDRFSELPDALLLNILERVGTLDAVRACVLSKKLMKLPAMLSRIVIDVGDVPPWRNDPTDHDMVRANRAVAELTDKFLAVRPPQLTIRDLKLTFILRNDHCLSIGRSVAQAMTMSKLDKVH